MNKILITNFLEAWKNKIKKLRIKYSKNKNWKTKFGLPQKNRN